MTKFHQLVINPKTYAESALLPSFTKLHAVATRLFLSGDEDTACEISDLIQEMKRVSRSLQVKKGS